MKICNKYHKRKNVPLKKIVEYWKKIIPETYMTADWDEAINNCWRCGINHSSRKLEKCHIIPRALGGSNRVDNLVLLCHFCHLENPNVNDSKIMWDWIKAYNVSTYGDFNTWLFALAVREYEFIYKENPIEEMYKINGGEDFVIKNFTGYISNDKYIGHQRGINIATMAGLLRMFIGRFQSKQEVVVDERNPTGETKR